MRTVIAGGRGFNDHAFFAKCIKSIPFEITTVLCGEARGADTLGRKWAIANGIPIEYYPANWDLGRHAGYLRNREMALACDVVICFWGGVSKGTKHMIDLANKHNKELLVFKY